MNDDWYSVRMRATLGGRHLSGAERIGRSSEVAFLTALLTGRAFCAKAGTPDDVSCVLKRLDPEMLEHAAFPDIRTWQVADWREGRMLAGRLLNNAGVSTDAAERCLRVLASGPAPGGGSMRGAMIVDMQTGERLEPDQARGVRVSHMDVALEDRHALEQALMLAGLGHHRVLEALVLSAKVLNAPGIVAELCWSDDPDYVTGYVASPVGGYQRIDCLKETGDPHGGRAFLVDSRTWRKEEFIAFIEDKPMLFHGLPVIRPGLPWRA
jgi:6-carboxyhexanoate--CoA ligase